MSLTLDAVRQGDCIKCLSELPEGSVDLAFADPPFNIGYDYDVYDDRKGAEEYLDWSRKWIAGVQRVLKPDGSFWLAIGDEFAAELKILATREVGFHCRSWVIWFYTFGVHCKYKFTRSHAHLFHFVKNPKKFTFNALDVRVPSARELVYGDKRAALGGRMPDDTWMMSPILPPEVATRDGFTLRPQDIPERFPQHSDTWFFSRVAGTFAERRGWHGCQMPEQLLGRIIRACSNKGDLVLDPFAGSGTTPVVAKKLERRYLAFELSKKYAKMAEQRLASIQPLDALDGPVDATLSAPKTSAGRRLKRSASPADKPVSSSPVLARANLSRWQVAVASGELFTAVAEAFMASHEGYSADRVLADPALNESFVQNCELLGIPGQALDWNHALLRLRKRGGLSPIDTSRRTLIGRAVMTPYIKASEVAWWKLSESLGYSLDDILCDPTTAERFDRLASKIAPGYSPLEYRWAALSLRKFVSKGAHILDLVDDKLAPRSVRLTKAAELRDAPGHFLITTCGEPFFAGFAPSLRHCSLFQAKQLHAAMEVMARKAPTDSEIEIRTRFSDLKELRKSDASVDEIPWEAARRAKLIIRHHPAANVPVSRSAA